MKKHPLLAAGAAAGTAVLGAAYAVYRVAFYQKPTTKVPSPADMPTRECYRKAMGPDVSQRALADMLQLAGMDVDKNAIQRIESGKRFVTDIELKILAQVLGVTVEDLLG